MLICHGVDIVESSRRGNVSMFDPFLWCFNVQPQICEPCTNQPVHRPGTHDISKRRFETTLNSSSPLLYFIDSRSNHRNAVSLLAGLSHPLMKIRRTNSRPFGLSVQLQPLVPRLRAPQYSMGLRLRDCEYQRTFHLMANASSSMNLPCLAWWSHKA